MKNYLNTLTISDKKQLLFGTANQLCPIHNMDILTNKKQQIHILILLAFNAEDIATFDCRLVVKLIAIIEAVVGAAGTVIAANL